MTAVQESRLLTTRAVGLIAGGLLVAAGAAYGLVHALAGDRYGPEGWPQDLAFGLPLSASGLVIVLGSLGARPVLVLAGGVAAIPMCVVSVLGFPAVFPAGVAIVVGASSLRGRSVGNSISGAAIVTALVFGFFYEVLHQDPASWTTPSGHASSSNVITIAESVVVYVTVGLALVLASFCLRADHPSGGSSATS